MNESEERSVPGLVSVILPVWNRREMLRDAVRSVERQTYSSVELILVDDGSTDDTADECERLGATSSVRTRVVHRPNGGPGAAREAGRRIANGEFIQYLDSDDLLDPRKLEVQVEALRADDAADIAYCRTVERRHGENPEERERPRTGERFETVFPAFLSGRLWPTLSPLYRRRLTDRMGPWTSLRQEEDLEYDARAGACGARLAYCPETLATVRHHAGLRSGGGSLEDQQRMRYRFESHRLVYAHARTAGLKPGDADLSRYAKELFLLARQCAGMGMSHEARELAGLAREAAAPASRTARQLAVFGLVARIAGWRAAGSAACRLDEMRRKRRERPV